MLEKVVQFCDVCWCDLQAHLHSAVYFIQTEKKSQDLKEKPAIEENAFEALERDFQEVCI